MQPGVSAWSCLWQFLCYLLFCGIHQYSFYFACSLGPTGAVTAGVSKCCQTVAMFFLSHHFFCSVASSQCVTPVKLLGSAGVCLGVMAYGFSEERSLEKLQNAKPVH